ncbi:MAG: exodeoxyribonuclease VII large subunit [Mycetocola sp.]
MSPQPATMEAPWPVAQLGSNIRDYIDRLGTVWIEGEITQWGGSGGNVYGKLKDVEQDATVSFTIWSSVKAKLPRTLAQGDRVVALVKVNYWVKGGTLTVQVMQMKQLGLGALLERIEQLRAQLSAEGLFAPERKKRLPFLPGTIGLITGKDSDAEKDVLRNAQLRWPHVRFRTVHSAVQGERTVPEVLSALSILDNDPDVEVIIIARGGGDFQNLLGFSDERVLRAVAAATTPVVSAIGHEADRPLLDEVADLRASTPTDAAKRVVPDLAEELLRVDQARGRLAQRVSTVIHTEQERIAQLRSRPALADGSWIVDLRSQELTMLVARGEERATRGISDALTGLDRLRAQMRALSPRATLDRGYAIVQDADGGIVRSPADAPEGRDLVLSLPDGRLNARSLGQAVAPGAPSAAPATED